ncbi:hypothetical protein ACH5BF_03070 [Arcobacter sp. YIC-464]|uniref:hypothetical protein n=1 Tax=Arcobacter sp. YIC-464 TaxID=3376631 RepID=UPI003C19112A
MLGNIWLSSALAVVAIFSASVAYKSYSDLQDVKHMQESYEIIRDIKTLLAYKYSIDPQDISRDEIIALLPQDGNWEWLLLLDRTSSADLENDALLQEDGSLQISEEQKLKLFALRAKLRESGNDDTGVTTDGVVGERTFTLEVGIEEKNISYKDEVIQKSIQKVIEIAYYIYPIMNESNYGNLVKQYIPYNLMYQDFSKDGETLPLDADVLKQRQEEYFKQRVLDELLKSQSPRDIKLYNKLKSFL